MGGFWPFADMSPIAGSLLVGLPDGIWPWAVDTDRREIDEWFRAGPNYSRAAQQASDTVDSSGPPAPRVWITGRKRPAWRRRLRRAV